MTVNTIRSLQGEEMLDVMYHLNMYCFRASPPLYNKEEWYSIVRERKGLTYFALFEHGRAATGAASGTMTQNVRGKLFPASGVWAVATFPAARRKGYCKQVMAALLESEHQAGKVFSNLYPFRESFYQKMGYTTFPLPVIARLSPAVLAPMLKQDLSGEVEIAMIGEAYERYRQFAAEVRSQVHGMAIFDWGDQVAANRNRQWAAFATIDGQVDGLMLYSLQGEEVSKFNFLANRFYYRTSRGRYLLLDWIARHIDQADRVEIHLAPFEHPETWLEDMKVKLESEGNAPMGRVLNVARLSGMQAGTGVFSARVSDALCPFNEGIWIFESVDGFLEVTPGKTADCDLSINGLTALVFGTHHPEDIPIRGWGNPSKEVQAVMGSVFPPRTPYIHEYF